MRITTKGQVITAAKWQRWRHEGKCTSEIAYTLGISPSMARLIGRRFREAGYDDPQYNRTNPGPIQEIDTTTEAGAYALGVLWGISSPNRTDKGFWVRHKDRWCLEFLQEYLKLTINIQESKYRETTQYRLKITRSADVATIENLLDKHGWQPRNSPVRPYPSGAVNDRAFVRAWVELHSSIDIVQSRKKHLTPRLRIYGNWLLLEEINKVITAGTGVPLRKPQNASNNTTKILCYVGSSCKSVADWLYKNATIYHPFTKLCHMCEPGL